MCGLYAYFNFNTTEEISESNIHSESLKSISYRGPDATKLSFFNSLNNSQNEFNIALGHNRLSIIDLSKAAIQPYSIEKYHLVFNGEIFNYIELREELILDGVSFITSSDTEVLLKSYIRWGNECFNKFNGMWAVVIYDSEKKKIIASRDRFSIKPLYFLKTKDEIVFGSEIKQLTPHIKNTLEPNFEVLRKYLALAILDDNNETFFTGINKIGPATFVEIDLNSQIEKTTTFWDYPAQKFNFSSEQDWLTEFKNRLKNSIQIRLRSDVKVGNTLSGGLDSSSIALLAQIDNPGLYNYSIISKDKKLSEEKYVDMLIERGMIIDKINSDEYDPWIDLKSVIHHHDEPILSFSAVNHYNMMRKIKNDTDLTVIISGQGGDEGLCGYNKYFLTNIFEKYKTGHFSKAFRLILINTPRLFKNVKLSLIQRYIGGGKKQKQILNFSISPDKDFSPFNMIRPRQISDYKKYSVPPLCHYEDRTSMAFGLEIRLPFLDHELVELLINMPTKYKIRGNWNKYVLRKSINELPKKIAWRKDKKGFDIPELKYFQLDTAKEHIANVENPDSFLKMNGLLNKDFKFDFTTKSPKVRLFSRLVFLEIWAKEHNL